MLMEKSSIWSEKGQILYFRVKRPYIGKELLNIHLLWFNDF